MIKTQFKQQGISIIEVLVSVFVLAVGILGVTKLQSASLGNAHKSLGRTQAAYLAYEILDRMRANPDQLYVIALGDMPENNENCLGASSTCTTEQLMDFDLAEWKCNFEKFRSTEECIAYRADTLSLVNGQNIYLNGDGSVSCSITGLEKYCEVGIQWLETTFGSETPKTHDFSIEVIL